MIISEAHVGGILIADTGGFCSVDIAHGNLSQNQEKAAWSVWPGVPGQGFGGGGGGFEFLRHKLRTNLNQHTCWQNKNDTKDMRPVAVKGLSQYRVLCLFLQFL